jgi:hypothetical protein
MGEGGGGLKSGWRGLRKRDEVEGEGMERVQEVE